MIDPKDLYNVLADNGLTGKTTFEEFSQNIQDAKYAKGVYKILADNGLSGSVDEETFLKEISPVKKKEFAIGLPDFSAVQDNYLSTADSGIKNKIAADIATEQRAKEILESDILDTDPIDYFNKKHEITNVQKRRLEKKTGFEWWHENDVPEVDGEQSTLRQYRREIDAHIDYLADVERADKGLTWELSKKYGENFIEDRISVAKELDSLVKEHEKRIAANDREGANEIVEKFNKLKDDNKDLLEDDNIAKLLGIKKRYNDVLTEYKGLDKQKRFTRLKEIIELRDKESAKKSKGFLPTLVRSAITSGSKGAVGFLQMITPGELSDYLSLVNENTDFKSEKLLLADEDKRALFPVGHSFNGIEVDEDGSAWKDGKPIQVSVKQIKEIREKGEQYSKVNTKSISPKSAVMLGNLIAQIFLTKGAAKNIPGKMAGNIALTGVGAAMQYSDYYQEALKATDNDEEASRLFALIASLKTGAIENIGGVELKAAGIADEVFTKSLKDNIKKIVGQETTKKKVVEMLKDWTTHGLKSGIGESGEELVEDFSDFVERYAFNEIGGYEFDNSLTASQLAEDAALGFIGGHVAHIPSSIKSGFGAHGSSVLGAINAKETFNKKFPEMVENGDIEVPVTTTKENFVSDVLSAVEQTSQQVNEIETDDKEGLASLLFQRSMAMNNQKRAIKSGHSQVIIDKNEQEIAAIDKAIDGMVKTVPPEKTKAVEENAQTVKADDNAQPADKVVQSTDGSAQLTDETKQPTKGEPDAKEVISNAVAKVAETSKDPNFKEKAKKLTVDEVLKIGQEAMFGGIRKAKEIARSLKGIVSSKEDAAQTLKEGSETFEDMKSKTANYQKFRFKQFFAKVTNPGAESGNVSDFIANLFINGARLNKESYLKNAGDKNTLSDANSVLRTNAKKYVAEDGGDNMDDFAQLLVDEFGIDEQEAMNAVQEFMSDNPNVNDYVRGRIEELLPEVNDISQEEKQFILDQSNKMTWIDSGENDISKEDAVALYNHITQGVKETSDVNAATKAQEKAGRETNERGYTGNSVKKAKDSYPILAIIAKQNKREYKRLSTDALAKEAQKEIDEKGMDASVIAYSSNNDLRANSIPYVQMMRQLLLVGLSSKMNNLLDAEQTPETRKEMAKLQVSINTLLDATSQLGTITGQGSAMLMWTTMHPKNVVGMIDYRIESLNKKILALNGDENALKDLQEQILSLKSVVVDMTLESRELKDAIAELIARRGKGKTTKRVSKNEKRIAKANKLIDEAWTEFRENYGLNAGINPAQLKVVVKLTRGYVLKGIVKIDTIYNEIAEKIKGFGIDLSEKDLGAIKDEITKEIQSATGLSVDKVLKAVKEGNLNEVAPDIAEEVKEEVKKAAKKVSESKEIEKKRKQMAKTISSMQSFVKKERKAKKALDKITGLIGDGVFEDNELLSGLYTTLGLVRPLSDEVKADLEQKVKWLHETDGTLKNIISAAIAKEIDFHIGSDASMVQKFMDLTTGVFYANVLAGYMTHAVNLSSAIANYAIDRVFTLPIASALKGSNVKVDRTGARRSLTFKRFADAWNKAVVTFSKGEVNSKYVESLSSSSRIKLPYLEKKVWEKGVMGKYPSILKYVGRALAAEDQFVRDFAFSGFVIDELSKKLKTRKEVIDAYIGANLTPDQLSEVNKRLAKEMAIYKNLANSQKDFKRIEKARRNELMREHWALTEDQADSATALSNDVMFIGNRGGVVPSAAKSIQNFIANNKGVGYFVRPFIPFTHVVGQVQVSMLDYAPGVAMWRLWADSRPKKVRKAKMGLTTMSSLLDLEGYKINDDGSIERPEGYYIQKARAYVGMMIGAGAAAFAYLTRDDDDTYITGGLHGFSDYGNIVKYKREPYSVYIGGVRLFNYKNIPGMAIPLSVVGNMADQEFLHKKQKEAGIKPSKAVWKTEDYSLRNDFVVSTWYSSFPLTLDMSFLSGASDVVDAAHKAFSIIAKEERIQGEKKRGRTEVKQAMIDFMKVLGKKELSLVASPLPTQNNFLKQTEKLFDPTVYSSKTVPNMIKYSIGLQRLLPSSVPVFDFLGNVMKSKPGEGNVMFGMGYNLDDYPDKEILDIILTENAAPEPPKYKMMAFIVDDKKVYDYPTDREYQYYRKVAGELFKKGMKEFLKGGEQSGYNQLANPSGDMPPYFDKNDKQLTWVQVGVSKIWKQAKGSAAKLLSVQDRDLINKMSNKELLELDVDVLISR